jgi:predicted ester cyclase
MLGTRDVVEAFYERFWRLGDEAAADALVAEAVVHGQFPAGWPSGREGVKRLVREWRTGFPDMDEEVLLVVHEGEWVTSRFRLTGTHTGPFYGLAPTGRRVDITGIDALRVRDGRIVEWHYQEDALGLFAQLGRFPDDLSSVAGVRSAIPPASSHRGIG